MATLHEPLRPEALQEVRDSRVSGRLIAKIGAALAGLAFVAPTANVISYSPDNAKEFVESEAYTDIRHSGITISVPLLVDLKDKGCGPNNTVAYDFDAVDTMGVEVPLLVCAAPFKIAELHEINDFVPAP